MRILGIETSCDETSIAIIEADGGLKNPQFEVISHALYSQIDIHKKYGGVFPTLAKRAHTENIVPILAEALGKAKLEDFETNKISDEKKEKVKNILEREPELFEKIISYLETINKPEIDAISVTVGPGLPPALWVGVNTARALSILWDIPIVGANHMEGHILSVLVNKIEDKKSIEFPAISLLISGGHTELVIMSDIDSTEKIGETKDDAIGEAFDKVARMMGLPYPGGPEIGKLAQKHRELYPVVENPEFPLPRPMLGSPDFDFSFSGIKTAVLYTIRDLGDLNENIKMAIAREFEDAVTEVIIKKTIRAVKEYGAKSIIIGGGVIASSFIRGSFEKETAKEGIDLFIPDRALSTDNAVMIAVAGYRKIISSGFDDPETLKANSNLSL